MKIYLGAIAWRSFEVGFVQSLMNLIRRFPQVRFEPLIGDALVERARSVVATRFLQTNADVLLTIDSDIMFAVDDAIQLCEQAMSHDIVCAPYVTRSQSDTKLTVTLDEAQPVEFALDPTPVEIKWGASGFMAIHRRVLEKLAHEPEMALCHPGKDWAFHPFYTTMTAEMPEVGRILLSEDYAFCERARQAGFSIWLNPAVRLGHQGTYVYRLEDMLLKSPEPQPLRVTQQGTIYRVESGVEPEEVSNGNRVRAASF